MARRVEGEREQEGRTLKVVCCLYGTVLSHSACCYLDGGTRPKYLFTPPIFQGRRPRSASLSAAFLCVPQAYLSRRSGPLSLAMAKPSRARDWKAVAENYSNSFSIYRAGLISLEAGRGLLHCKSEHPQHLKYGAREEKERSDERIVRAL